MINRKKVLGYQFVNSNMDKLTDEIHSRILEENKTFIVTVNPEIITYAQSDSLYEKILKTANYIIPDGVGIILASRIMRRSLEERLAGFDLMERLLSISNQEKYSIYLLGTKPQYINNTALNIKEKYPNVQVVGYHHGYFQEEEQEIINEIKRKKPDIIFVGLGFPKQEKWIAKNLSHFHKGIFIGVGGSLNVWAGVAKRAPKIWRALNLEWLYRLIKEPSRWRRMIAIPVFLKRVLNKEFL